jgi:hypothetical protein
LLVLALAAPAEGQRPPGADPNQLRQLLLHVEHEVAAVDDAWFRKQIARVVSRVWVELDELGEAVRVIATRIADRTLARRWAMSAAGSGGTVERAAPVDPWLWVRLCDAPCDRDAAPVPEPAGDLVPGDPCSDPAGGEAHRTGDLIVQHGFELPAGCATTAAEPPTGRRPMVLKQQEIVASSAPNLYTAVERLRPRWLRPRAASPSLMNSGQGVLVYQSNLRLGGVEVLRHFGSDAVSELRFVDRQTASNTLPALDLRAVAGVIVIVSPGQRRPTVPPGQHAFYPPGLHTRPPALRPAAGAELSLSSRRPTGVIQRCQARFPGPDNANGAGRRRLQ